MGSRLKSKEKTEYQLPVKKSDKEVDILENGNPTLINCLVTYQKDNFGLIDDEYDLPVV